MNAKLDRINAERKIRWARGAIADTKLNICEVISDKEKSTEYKIAYYKYAYNYIEECKCCINSIRESMK